MGIVGHALLGGGLAFAATIQPGPLQAFLISRVAATGWRRTLPACLAPLVSDGPIALLVLLVVGQLPLAAQHLLRAAGGAFMLYLAWTTLRQWRDARVPEALPSAPRTLLEAVTVNVLNPSPWLGWALIMGPSAVTAWERQPSHAVALVGSFYGILVLTLAGFILLVGLAGLLGARGQRVLLAISGTALAGLGAFLLVSAVSRLLGS